MSKTWITWAIYDEGNEKQFIEVARDGKAKRYYNKYKFTIKRWAKLMYFALRIEYFPLCSPLDDECPVETTLYFKEEVTNEL